MTSPETGLKTKPEPGQIWSSDKTDIAPPLIYIVGHVEPGDPGLDIRPIVSVSMTPHPDARKVGWPALGHVPVTLTAFERSGLKLHSRRTEPRPSFAAGYAAWREQYDAGGAGAFDAPLPEVYLAIAARSVREGLKPAND